MTNLPREPLQQGAEPSNFYPGQYIDKRDMRQSHMRPEPQYQYEQRPHQGFSNPHPAEGYVRQPSRSSNEYQSWQHSEHNYPHAPHHYTHSQTGSLNQFYGRRSEEMNPTRFHNEPLYRQLSYPNLSTQPQSLARRDTNSSTHSSRRYQEEPSHIQSPPQHPYQDVQHIRSRPSSSNPQQSFIRRNTESSTHSSRGYAEEPDPRQLSRGPIYDQPYELEQYHRDPVTGYPHNTHIHPIISSGYPPAPPGYISSTNSPGTHYTVGTSNPPALYDLPPTRSGYAIQAAPETHPPRPPSRSSQYSHYSRRSQSERKRETDGQGSDIGTIAIDLLRPGESVAMASVSDFQDRETAFTGDVFAGQAALNYEQQRRERDARTVDPQTSAHLTSAWLQSSNSDPPHVPRELRSHSGGQTAEGKERRE
jgi:hypothetical protein